MCCTFLICKLNYLIKGVSISDLSLILLSCQFCTKTLSEGLKALSKMGFETKVLKNAKVFYRIMPQEKMKWDYVKVLDDRKTIYMRSLQEQSVPEVAAPSYWNFQSDYVFWNNTQDDVYQTVMDGVLERVMGGSNAIITAFGQTGTGKSLTVNGLNCFYKDRGLLPRIITDLFQAKSAMENNVKVCIQISYVEISRQYIVDLLKPYPDNNVSIRNVSKVKITNEEEALRHLFISEGRKEFASTDPYLANLASSIFTFRITTKDVKMCNTPNIVSYLHVIDLAGADTVGNTSCLFKHPQDIGTGNLAKTQLEQFLLVLNEDIADVIKVKYRLNTMIQYLGDALSSKSVLRFIGHLSIAREDAAVTISMLRFGQILLGMKSKANDVNQEEMGCPEKLQMIQSELEQLKRENKFNAILEKKELSTGINADRYGHIERTVTEYIQDKINEVDLVNVTDVGVVLEVFKKKLKSAEEENKRRGSLLLGSVIKPKGVKESKTSLRSLTAEQRKSSTDKSSILKAKRGSKDDSKTSNIGLRKSGGSVVKQSSSNLIKNQSQTRRKSGASNASITLSKKGSKVKSKTSALLLVPEIVPEYAEAWTAYVHEKFNEYHNFSALYETNENLTREVYKNYLDDVNRLQETTLKLEKTKNDLMLAKMTRDYQYGTSSANSTDFEKACLNNLNKVENELLQRRETVLKSQAELRIHVDVCKNIKKDLKNAFEDYCKEKYQMPVEDIVGADSKIMDVEQMLNEESLEAQKEEPEEQEMGTSAEYAKASLFESMKHLITREFRKKNLYKEQHKDWEKLYKI